MNRRYRSKVDWWLYLIMVAMVAVAIFMMIDAPSIGTGILSVFLIAMMPYCILTTWYAIDGNTLIVHWMFVTERLPIDKISEIKLCTGILAGATTSTKRVSIKFNDRKVLKSYAPLEISPKDRIGFIKDLLRVNPNIKAEY